MAACVDDCEAEVGGLRGGDFVGGGGFVDVVCELEGGFGWVSFGFWDCRVVGRDQGEFSI